MKIPYGYVLSASGEIVIDEKKAEVVCLIFGYYLAGASLGRVGDMLFAKGIPSPSGNPRWTRAAIDKLLSNPKYVAIVGLDMIADAQIERESRSNVDYEKVNHLRKQRGMPPQS